MSEVLRLRLSRAPQRLVNKNVVRWQPSPDVPTPQVGRLVAAKKAAKKVAKKTANTTGTLMERLLANPNTAQRQALSYTSSARFVGRGAALAVPVRELDWWLVEHENRAMPKTVVAECLRLFGTPLTTTVASAAWRNERQRVYDSFVASLIAHTEPALGAELTRLLLIFALVEDLARTPSPINTADEVENALRYRTVLIPKEILKLVPRRARLARRYGFADLFVVRDEWNRYEAGEIAHIENVLPRESKKRSLSTLSEAEVTTTSETETLNVEENDSQTTERMEIQQHAQRETDMGIHVAAQVEIEASYGPMHIAATVGGSFDYSQKEAEEHAYQQSREMITRAVKRVEERVKTTRVTRSLQRTTEENLHSLENKSANRVVGVYRWVDKVQRLQLFRYPHRFLLEFQIPEPAAYLMWRRSRPRSDLLTPEPAALVRRDAQFRPVNGTDGKPVPLLPSDITETTYQWWVAQYHVMGVSQSPPTRVQVTTRLELKEQVPPGAAAGGGGGGAGQNSVTPSLTDKSLFDLLTPGGNNASQPGVTIPQGYRLGGWSASGYAADDRIEFDTQGYAVIRPSIDITVGSVSVAMTRNAWVLSDTTGLIRSNQLGAGNNTTPVPTLGGYRFTGTSSLLNYPVAQPVTGTVQILAHLAMVKECVIQITLNCERMDAALWRWQQQTYEQISAAYFGLKRQRADEIAAQEIGSGIDIKGDPPSRNKEVVLEELKRGVIELLTGANLQGRNGMQAIPDAQPPQMDLDNAASIADEIQFIEQAIEWENLTYVLYPYFWARQERWAEIADLTLADPEFARFLRSGSARVVVPARPKFEDQVRMYVDFGALWGGGPAPAVDEPDYLSVAAEIMAQQSPPDDGEKRRSWEVRLPTTLVWLDSDNALPKMNPSPALQAPPGTQMP